MATLGDGLSVLEMLDNPIKQKKRRFTVNFFFYTHLQSWTKVLGTVPQYSYFSVILFSRFPLKTVHPFQNFLAVLPPPTLYKFLS